MAMDNNTTLTAVASIQEQFNRAVSLDQDTSATFSQHHRHRHQEEEQQELELELFTEFVALMKFSSFHDSTDDDDGDGDDSIVDEDAVKTKNNGTVLVRPMPYRDTVRGGQKVPVVGKTAAATAVSTNYNKNDDVKYHHSTPLPHAALFATGEYNTPLISDTVKGRGILMRTSSSSSSSSAPPMIRFANTNTPSRKGEDEEEMNGSESDSTSIYDDSTSTLVMKIINSNAKFSPIVQRSFNPDLQVTPADRHGSSSITPLAPVGGVAHDITMQPSKTERDEEVIQCRLPTAPTRLTLKQSAGPPKIPTLRKEDDEATSIIVASLGNNTNQDHDNEDKIDDDEEDDEVSGITSSTKKTKNNKHSGKTVVKSPPLVPRKRSLGYYDDDPTLSCTKCSSSSRISSTSIAGNPFFQDERLLLPLPPTSKKKCWIPPRRPTKKSRLFLIDHPHDDNNAENNNKVDREEGVDDQNLGVDYQDEIKDHDLHHHPGGGLVATFSLFSSSSSCASIDTLHSCSSPILSAAANSSVITNPAAASHSLAGRYFTVPLDEQYADASINIFFTPPRSDV